MQSFYLLLGWGWFCFCFLFVCLLQKTYTVPEASFGHIMGSGYRVTKVTAGHCKLTVLHLQDLAVYPF